MQLIITHCSVELILLITTKIVIFVISQTIGENRQTIVRDSGLRTTVFRINIDLIVHLQKATTVA